MRAFLRSLHQLSMEPRRGRTNREARRKSFGGATTVLNDCQRDPARLGAATALICFDALRKWSTTIVISGPLSDLADALILVVASNFWSGLCRSLSRGNLPDILACMLPS